MKKSVSICAVFLSLFCFFAIGQENGNAKGDILSQVVPELQFYSVSDMNKFDLDDKIYGNFFHDFGEYNLKFKDARLDSNGLNVIGDNKFIFNRNPYSLDFNSVGILTSWNNGYISASGERSTLPGLFSRQSASVSFMQNFGKITFHASLTTDKYQLFRGLQNNFGIGGTLTYQVQDNLSFNVFGTYYKNSLYFSPAALPYIGQSNYGAYATMQFGERFGMDAGVKREFNPYGNRWLTLPIVTPYIKLNIGAKIGVDVGWLVGRIIDDVFNDGNYYNPKYSNQTVAPPVPQMPPVR